MSPKEVQGMRDREIADMLFALKPSGDSLAWLAALIADPVGVAGVNELSRRYSADHDDDVRRIRHGNAASVHISGDRLRHFCWSRRITLTQFGELAGKSNAFGSVVCHKGRLNYWTADTIATELGLHVDDFIAQIAAPDELERLSCV